MGVVLPVSADQEIKALTIIQNALKIEGPFTTELLSGGLSGSILIKVSTPDKAFVVRFWDMRWVDYYPQDLACQKIASEAGYGARLFFVDEVSCTTVMEYLNLEHLPEAHLRLHALAEMLRRIHQGPRVPLGLDKRQEYANSIEEVVRLNPRYLDLDAIRTVVEEVYLAVGRDVDVVPCHRDLHPGNVIFTKGRFVAIDYTWGGMDDPYVDLATVAVFHCSTQEQEHFLLQNYLGRVPTSMEIARLSLMKLLSKIFYGLEVIKFAPTSLLNGSMLPSFLPKRYLNFGLHGGPPLTSTDCWEYAMSILTEVIGDFCTEQYRKDLEAYASG